MTDPTIPASEHMASCPGCGRAHNLISRMAGDTIWCQCGKFLWVLFAPARLVVAGRSALWADTDER